MTHGVESGPESNQDPAALTYLEGLLMHPVTTGPAPTVIQRSELAHGNENSTNRVTFHVNDNIIPSPKNGVSPCAASQHLKKARLLRSETWREENRQKQSGTIEDVNGQRSEHYRGAHDSSGQGESTLLASLLQSFSSRLQSVALSQHISQSHKQLDTESGVNVPNGKETFQSYGSASGCLKSLMKKSKQQKHCAVPYCHQGNQNQASDSTFSSQPTNSVSISCTERLKAVASMVKTRSSPACSPKPSVACSQLALMLSSEAHLQQYSKEQALKARLTSRSASERLAAMATQKLDSMPPSMGQPSTTPPMLSSLNINNGTASPQVANCAKRSPSLPSPTVRPPKERRPFDRQSRPPQNCSSLLLLLLNNQNSQQSLTRNGHLEDNSVLLPSQAFSRHSDSEYCDPDNSITKDGSKAESFSIVSPIDLSMKNRVSCQKSEQFSSLDKLTESFINNWKHEPLGSKVDKVAGLDTCPNIKSQDKVTLMQLLLERRNNENVNKLSDDPGLHPDAVISRLTAGPVGHVARPEASRLRSPLEQQSSYFSSLSPSYSFPSPHGQQSPSPLDLCMPKFQALEKEPEPPFSASKLLQNLAQSGKSSLSPSPPPLLLERNFMRKRQSPDLEHDEPISPLNRGFDPAKKKDGGSLPRVPLNKSEQSYSTLVPIENLLEKRTVLQLLLGTATQKERSSGISDFEGSSGVLEQPQVVSVDHSSESVLNNKIKIEPPDQNSPLESLGDRVLHQRRSSQDFPNAQAPDMTKSEQCPLETAARFGLLSQLLKQQNTIYPSSPLTKLPPNAVKEEHIDFHSSIPKKRKLCIELAEHLSNELCQPSGNDNLESGTSEFKCRRLETPKAGDFVCDPWNKTSPPRDSHGFNVLKQLLLSENSLKEFSQPRGTPSPIIPQATNGNSTHCGFSNESSNSPWYPAPKSMPKIGDSRGWGKASPNVGSMPFEGCTEDILTKGERSSPDSPPLTRSNPILYYMLQRGKGQLRPEIQDQTMLHMDYEHRINSTVPGQTRNHRGESFNGPAEKQ
ncbi:hypothetical protein DNTS_022918 [Danionella cerebrum]|uniref:Nuclear receptor-interacting protein 1 repression domain-containing protein n=1 Tax=Danionella cerebrum TaxID=2873325 RepID=A0A553QTM6_9TELE|nr:hypothetical protein DNTS_022918 [Danionella translucida]